MVDVSILEQASKERFRRNILIASRVLALLLIIALFFIGFSWIKYAKQFNDLKDEYGPNAYCYLCGYYSGKSCSCNYIPKLTVESDNFDREQYFIDLALINSQDCNELKKEQEKQYNSNNLLNIS